MGPTWGRNLLGGAAILAAILGVAVVLPAIDRAVPADKDAAQRLTIANGITVVPPTGAMIGQRTRAGPTTGSILFLVGQAHYVVSVEPFEGDAAEAAQRLRAKIQDMPGYQVTNPESPVVTSSGLSGMGSQFTAPGHSGRYAAFVVPGRAIEVTVNVSENDFQHALLPIDSSITSISWDGGK